MARYLNPFTDFGFKKLFGNEQNKELLISFLNQILPDNQISVINYLHTEHLGQTDLDRKVIYDLYCENERGEKFIVELQKAKQSFFKDRTLFYATFPIQEQAQQGDWNDELKAVYTVAVLDFCFDDEDRDKVKVQVKLMDTEQKTMFYDKLTFVYLQMPNFRKTEEELETLEDKWFYLLRHLAELQNRPQRLQDKVFDRLFEIAEIASFNPEEREAYEDSLKYYRDVKNSLETAREEGRGKGIRIGKEEEKINIALRMLAKGFTPAQIRELTGLSESETQKMGKR